MQHEPQHPIESSLRDWAATRRRQAGAPFELHSVDRARLQAEVARSIGPQTPTAPRSTPLWRRFLPRLALGLGTAGLLFWGVQQLAPLRNDSGMDLAHHQASRTEPSLSLAMDEAPEQAAAPPALAATDPPPASVLPSPSAVRSHPAPAARRSIDPSLDRSDRVSQAGDEPLALRQREPLTTSPQISRAASVPYTGLHSVPDAESQPPAPPALQPPDWTGEFYRLQAPRRNFNAPPDLALRSFRVERRGEALRLLDEDGSIYEGTLLTREPDPAWDAWSETFADEMLASDGLSFQVSGTNRSAQMDLVFQGVLLTGATDRIQGHAVLGGRDRIVVDAQGIAD